MDHWAGFLRHLSVMSNDAQDIKNMTTYEYVDIGVSRSVWTSGFQPSDPFLSKQLFSMTKVQLSSINIFPLQIF